MKITPIKLFVSNRNKHQFHF